MYHTVAVLVWPSRGGYKNHPDSSVFAGVVDLGSKWSVPAPAPAKGCVGGRIAGGIAQDDHHLALYIDPAVVVVLKAPAFFFLVGCDSVACEGQWRLDGFPIGKAKGCDLGIGSPGDLSALLKFDDGPGILDETGALGNGEVLEVGSVVAGGLKAVLRVETRNVFSRNFQPGFTAVAAAEVVAGKIGYMIADLSGVGGQLFRPESWGEKPATMVAAISAKGKSLARDGIGNRVTVLPR